MQKLINLEIGYINNTSNREEWFEGWKKYYQAQKEFWSCKKGQKKRVNNAKHFCIDVILEYQKEIRVFIEEEGERQKKAHPNLLDKSIERNVKHHVKRRYGNWHDWYLKDLKKRTLWRNCQKWFEEIREDWRRATINRLYTKLENVKKTDDYVPVDFDSPPERNLNDVLQTIINDPNFDTIKKELSIGHIQAKVRAKERKNKVPKKEKLGSASIPRLMHEALGYHAKNCEICSESIIIKGNRPYNRNNKPHICEGKI